MKLKHPDLFEEKSNIDQDDAYGNYKPAFLIKSAKVAGRSDEIMKLQRQASTDQERGLLRHVQLEKILKRESKKRSYPDKSNIQTFNFGQELERFSEDGTMLPN